MIDKDVFKGKNINLFSPYSNELLYDYIYSLEYTDEASKDWKARHVVLSVLKTLFELDVIYVYKWYNQPELKNKKLTINETIIKIDDIWFENAIYPDFYNMVMFGSQKWYVDALEKIGMTHTTNWENFVKEKIGDLEQWIERNRPKKNTDNKKIEV